MDQFGNHGAETDEQVPARRAAGAAAIALAVLFNVPYAVLTVTYDYPAVLRRPAGEALALFAAGGDALVLTWHAFALSALTLAPLAFALALTPRAMTRTPALAIGAAIAGASAAVAQAVGLWRWVFVVPGLAETHTDPLVTVESRLAAERTFDLINQYGGVAIGEHLGQLLTALFVVLVSVMQWGEGRRVSAGIGFITALAIVVGTNEGVALALNRSGEAFSTATIVGFLSLTVWLIATGAGLLRARRVPARAIA